MSEWTSTDGESSWVTVNATGHPLPETFRVVECEWNPEGTVRRLIRVEACRPALAEGIVVRRTDHP